MFAPPAIDITTLRVKEILGQFFPASGYRTYDPDVRKKMFFWGRFFHLCDMAPPAFFALVSPSPHRLCPLLFAHDNPYCWSTPLTCYSYQPTTRATNLRHPPRLLLPLFLASQRHRPELVRVPVLG